jgi:hypothetical protein
VIGQATANRQLFNLIDFMMVTIVFVIPSGASAS